MKTVFRNNNEEETGVKSTWYAVVSEEEIDNEEMDSRLFHSEDAATDTATESYCGTMYVAEIKLITKVVG